MATRKSPGRGSEELDHAANRNCNRVILVKQKHINQSPNEIINLIYNLFKVEESTIICLRHSQVDKYKHKLTEFESSYKT